MEAERTSYLFSQYQHRQLSELELEEFKLLVSEPEFDSHFHDIFDHNWKSLKHEDLVQISAETKERQLSYITFQSCNQRKQTRLWPRIAGIAAAITAILFGVWFFSYRVETLQDAQNSKVNVNDIAPGRNGATITLASGKVIQLSDLQSGVIIGDDSLVYNDGTAIATSEKVQVKAETFIATTAKGQTYTFTLPDGTKIWMNADSKLSFAQPFINKTRAVFLEGEAYFEVAKDKRRPFILSSRGQQIEVLGTHFNVNSYANEAAVATALLEGSVKVTSNGKQKVIKPGEQSLTNGNGIKVEPVDVENVLDWKDGDFFLNHVNFKTAMRKIARWYDVEMIYDSSVPDDIESGGWISRSRKLSEVLKHIESSGQVHFRMEGTKVYVSRRK